MEKSKSLLKPLIDISHYQAFLAPLKALFYKTTGLRHAFEVSLLISTFKKGACWILSEPNKR